MNKTIAAAQVQQTSFLPHSTGMLQRKCACGNRSAGGECTACAKKKNTLQRNPGKVESNISLGQEANQVLKKPAHSIVPGTPLHIQRYARQAAENTFTAPPSVDRVLSSPGRPLESSLRNDMEKHFDRDFSQVRIHSGIAAEQSAREVNANAYTAGNNIVFGAGQFAPETHGGRRLIAHEMTHVVQQQSTGNVLQGKLKVGPVDDKYEREADQIADSLMNHNFEAARHVTPVTPNIQRDCGSQAIDTPTGCVFRPGNAVGLRYLFVVDCDDFERGNEDDLRIDAANIRTGEIVDVHGLASAEGDPTYNLNLSCARALRAKAVIEGVLLRRGVTATIQVFNHGPVPGNVVQQRSVVVTRRTPTPTPSEVIIPPPKCGPDATDWFIREVAGALIDPAVLAVKRDMDHADRLARRYGTTASALAEGGVTARVLAEELKLRTLGPTPPPRNPTITSQLATGAAVGAAATVAATPTGPFDRRIIDTPRMLLSIQSAASAWAALVTHGATYDFKAHVMDHPRSPNCPDPGCVPKEVGTVTLCPGHASANCYESDLPGNIFYALIGKHVGFSLNTLQLGSQLAELTDVTPRPARPVITWDTPDDTAAINLGFRLPLALTRSTLCSVVPPARGSLSLPTTNCDDCPDVM